ncbi:hypothetical protein ACFWD7_04100 [Streptomyces mirabilis]|uniref:hypothetical protein n=1 Tax=Streptomyces mirabilis TaxID=68239 RepID=UPI0036A782EA
MSALHRFPLYGDDPAPSLVEQQAPAEGLTVDGRTDGHQTASDVGRYGDGAQVYLSMLDVADPRKRSVIRLVLTATASQHPTVLDDFRDFVRTGTGTDTDTGTAS